MACSMKIVFSHPGSFEYLKPRKAPALSSKLWGNSIFAPNQRNYGPLNLNLTSKFSIKAQASTLMVPKIQKWWVKTLKPNMVEINSAQELVDTLKNAGERLVIAGFFSPGCGGCRSLHPKVCQLAEANPDAIFLQINYEELNPMCQALHVHVLPFFRFYKGAEGRVCSFSCTIATIKKFKDALAKYGEKKYSVGPAKGLEDSELMKLAMIGEIQAPLPSLIEENEVDEDEKIEELVLMGLEMTKNPLINFSSYHDRDGSKDDATVGAAVLAAA